LIKKIYFLISSVVILLVFLATCLIFILSNELCSQYLLGKILSNQKIEYSKIKGSIFDGLVLHDIKYDNTIFSKTLELRYDLKKLFSTLPKLQYIKIDGLIVDADSIQSSEENSKDTALGISFALEELQLTHTKVLFNKQEIDLEIEARNIFYDGALSAKNLLLEVVSADANITMNGAIESNRLKAKMLLTPSKNLYETHLSLFKGIAKTFPISIDTDLSQASFEIEFENIFLQANNNLALSNVKINLDYFISENYFTLETEYKLSYNSFESQVAQTAIFTPLGEYYSELNASILKASTQLPFKTFKAQIAGNSSDMTASLDTPKIHFELLGREYESFIIRGMNQPLCLAFSGSEFFKNDILKFHIQALLTRSPFAISGKLSIEDMYAQLEGNFESYGANILALAKVQAKPQSALYKKYKLDLFSPLWLVFYGNEKKAFMNADANLLNISLLKEDDLLTGWGNLAQNFFEISGDISQNTPQFLLNTNIPSLNTTLEEFSLNYDIHNGFYDAEVDINATITLADKIEVDTKINIPWYVIQTDSQTKYHSQNLFAHLRISDNEIDVLKYNIPFSKYIIKSDRPSKIFYKQNAAIEFKEFWIYDNLKLTGVFNAQEMQGDLQLKSNAFEYNGNEGNISAKVDINAHFTPNNAQKITGSITLLEGTLKYEPATDYTISDEDIIIIQDMKEQSKIDTEIEIHIDSVKPITYKTKDIDMKFTPDFSIIQELHDVPRIYGEVGLKEGVIQGGGKIFRLEESAIYFAGDKAINPYLNLHLKHRIDTDNIDIDIFVTNTMASPVIIFASTPALSQDDILSYILFGEPAGSVFESSNAESTKLSLGVLFMGTGLKTIFNDISGINIDKLSIMTNSEGTLGYEIGARFNKKIRLVYTHDNTQSITLQYSLNKSMRVDVDVYESEQGVTILYVKSYEDLEFLKKN